MLREWWTSRLSRTASSAARRLGYPDELAALAARHRRCKATWRPHLEATRRTLLEQGRCHGDRQGCALILGAGLLEDIPWRDLLEHFGMLRLVDAVFPLTTRRLATRQRGRLELMAHDLTGVIDALAAGRTTPIPSDRMPPALLQDVAWIASVNCLTQLPLAPVAWLLKQGSCETAAEAHGQAIIAAHLEQLTTAGPPCCLISERADRRYDRAGGILAATDYGPLLDPRLAASGARLLEAWDWLVHPPGELANGETEIRRVAAWALAIP